MCLTPRFANGRDPDDLEAGDYADQRVFACGDLSARCRSREPRPWCNVSLPNSARRPSVGTRYRSGRLRRRTHGFMIRAVLACCEQVV